MAGLLCGRATAPQWTEPTGPGAPSPSGRGPALQATLQKRCQAPVVRTEGLVGRSSLPDPLWLTSNPTLVPACHLAPPSTAHLVPFCPPTSVPQGPEGSSAQSPPLPSRRKPTPHWRSGAEVPVTPLGPSPAWVSLHPDPGPVLRPAAWSLNTRGSEACRAGATALRTVLPLVWNLPCTGDREPHL